MRIHNLLLLIIFFYTTSGFSQAKIDQFFGEELERAIRGDSITAITNLLNKKINKDSIFSEHYIYIKESHHIMAKFDPNTGLCNFIKSNEDFLIYEISKKFQQVCINKIFTYLSRPDTNYSYSLIDKYFSSLPNNEVKIKQLRLLTTQQISIQAKEQLSNWYLTQLKENKIGPDELLISNFKIEGYDLSRFYFQKEKSLNLEIFKTELSSLLKEVSAAPTSSNSPSDLPQYVLSYLFRNRDFLKDEAVQAFIGKTGRFLIINENINAAKEIFTLNNLDSVPNQNNAFYSILVLLLENNLSEAYKFILSKKLLNSFEALPTKLKFWIGYVIFKHTNNPEYLKQVAIDHKFEFYGIVSNEILDFKVEPIAPVDKKIIAKYISKNNNLENSLLRLKLWLKIKSHSFSDREVKRNIDIITKGNTPDHSDVMFENLAKTLHDNDGLIHLTSNFNKIIKHNPNSTLLSIIKYCFPQKYFGLFNKNSDKFLTTLSLSLTKQESAFQTNAKSSAGALGLMQIMPATGRAVQRGVSKKHLLNPGLNIKIGQKYLKSLIQKYDGNIIYSLAAYNAGPNRVNRWNNVLDRFKSNPLLMIELIPFEETNNYVKYIYRNFYFYNLLYGPKEPTKIKSWLTGQG